MRQQLIANGSVKFYGNEEAWAIFSVDGLHRYELGRRWAPGGLVMASIGQNPSKANHEANDMTIMKDMGFAAKHGCNALVKVNLGAFIATDPKCFIAADDPLGRFNNVFLQELGGYHLVVAAWGGMPDAMWAKVRPSIVLIKAIHAVKCFGKTKKGAPKHTSRIAYATPIENWRT